MRVGLMGAGRIGSVHAGSLAANAEVAALAIGDVDRTRAERLAGEVGSLTDSAVADLETILSSCDAFVIASPTDTHAALLGQAAEAGLPTFCEKPIALDLETTVGVAQQVAAAGIQVQMGFQRRFDGGYRRARRLVEDGSLGRLFLVRLSTYDEGPPPEEYLPRSGGFFRDTSIHDFDIARYVTGREVVEVYADGSALGHEMFARHDDIDTSAAVLRFDDGMLGVLNASRHDPLGHDVRMELLGSSNSVAVGWNERTPIELLEPEAEPLAGPPYRSFLERFAAAYRAEMDAFVDVAAGRTVSASTVEDARQALRIAEACDRSRAEHRPVSLEEIP